MYDIIWEWILLEIISIEADFIVKRGKIGGIYGRYIIKRLYYKMYIL